MSCETRSSFAWHPPQELRQGPRQNRAAGRSSRDMFCICKGFIGRQTIASEADRSWPSGIEGVLGNKHHVETGCSHVGSLSVARGCFPAADSQFTIGQAKSKNAYTHEGMDRWNGERWLSSQEMLDEDE